MSKQPFGVKPWERAPTGSQFTRPTKSPNRSRSGSPGIFNAIGLGQPSLSVTLAEELLYLHPTAEGVDVPTEDPWVSGVVTLYLPKARKLQSLTVQLLGKQDVGFPPDSGKLYESSVILDKEVALAVGDEDGLLEKGEHSFSFSIIVPSSTATYERCQYGRIRHTITARAKGLGPIGGDVVSDEKILFLVVNPGGAGESIPPPPLHIKVEGLIDEIGAYTLALQSQYCMVAGLLLLRFNLISAPTDLIIYSLKVKILQHFNLQSFSDPSAIYTAPVDPRTVLIIDAAHPPNFGIVEGPSNAGRSGSQTPQSGPFKILSKGSGFKLHHLVRLPNDNAMRPSTQRGTETGIHVRHDIVLEVTYSVGSGDPTDKKKGKEAMKERRKLVVSKPIDIFSCCCFLDSLTLPVYSILDPNPEPELYSPPCVCGLTIGKVIKYHGKHLLREEGEEGVTYAPIHKEDSGASTPVDRGRSGFGGREVFMRTESGRSVTTLEG